MQFEPGQWVRTDKGDVAKVIHISRLSVFVELQGDKAGKVESHLMSQVTKIESPDNPEAK